jgi:methylphosphotriester-DNA--protein-cysteine methyltransferase
MCGARAAFDAEGEFFNFAASTLLVDASFRGSRRASPRSSFSNEDRGRGASVLESMDEGVADAGLLSGTSCSG